MAGLVSLWLCAGGLATVDATVLPQRHEYQRVLRAYMGALTEKDFDHGVETGTRRQYADAQVQTSENQPKPVAGVGPLTTPPSSPDAERQFRDYLLERMIQPMIGPKRGAPAIKHARSTHPGSPGLTVRRV